MLAGKVVGTEDMFLTYLSRISGRVLSISSTPRFELEISHTADQCTFTAVLTHR